MSCDVSKERLMDYLYQELEPDQHQAMEEHVEGCETCRAAEEKFAGTSRMLRAWQDEDPEMDLVFVQDRVPLWKSLVPDWLSGWPPNILVSSITRASPSTGRSSERTRPPSTSALVTTR